MMLQYYIVYWYILYKVYHGYLMIENVMFILNGVKYTYRMTSGLSRYIIRLFHKKHQKIDDESWDLI